MADRFTREEAKHAREAADGMFEAIPKTRRMEYIGHLNDVLLFIGDAERRMPKPEVSAELTSP